MDAVKLLLARAMACVGEAGPAPEPSCLRCAPRRWQELWLAHLHHSHGTLRLSSGLLALVQANPGIWEMKQQTVHFLKRPLAHRNQGWEAAQWGLLGATLTGLQHSVYEGPLCGGQSWAGLQHPLVCIRNGARDRSDVAIVITSVDVGRCG